MIQVVGLDEEDNWDEVGQHGDKEGEEFEPGLDGGNEIRQRKDSTEDEAKANRYGEATSDVSDQTTAAITVTKIPPFQYIIKDTHSIMEVTPNSLAFSNSTKNN